LHRNPIPLGVPKGAAIFFASDFLNAAFSKVFSAKKLTPQKIGFKKIMLLFWQ